MPTDSPDLPVLTVGYGGRSLAELLALLREHGVQVLVDVRSVPLSRSRPEFSRSSLEAAVRPAGIRYVFQGQYLGGRPECPECYEEGRLLHARVKEQPFYQEGLRRLEKAHAQGMRMALLCSEAKPEECHRARLIGESLSALGLAVQHLDAEGALVPHDAVRTRLEDDGRNLFSEACEETRPAGGAYVETPALQADPAADRERALATLRTVWGYNSFRSHQEEVVLGALRGRDALLVMPTGGGKSLCYQLPALLREGLTVVVSPLISLMQDQVDSLRQMGVPAAFLNSSLDQESAREARRQVRTGEVKLLYLAPETLLQPGTLALLDESRVGTFAVDEAHCISSWGHDFRPEYRRLAPLRQRFPDAVCLALTATATPRVREDIARQLGIPPGQVRVASFDRENLHLAVKPREDGLGQLRAFLQSRKRSAGIVYCGTRKQVEEVAAGLRAAGWNARGYHAGMEDEERRAAQRAFLRDDVEVIVATVAFGMGINKSNVRFVVHYHLPESLEGYYQEIGRAGRDGLPSDCLLLHGGGDPMTLRRFIDQGSAEERPGREARLQAMLHFARTRQCRRANLLRYFGEEPEWEQCGACDACARAERNEEATDYSERARRFMEAVLQLRQRFGAAHVIEVLRGSRSAKVLQKGHGQLKCYGTGSDLSATDWRRLSWELIEQGALVQEPEHGCLQVTEQGQRILAGEPFMAVLEKDETAKTQRSDEIPAEAALFERLRALRREIADEQGVPPYLVFSDRTLTDMASRLPQSPESFATVNGVGERKLAAFGERFLTVIRAYCQEQGLEERTAAAAPKPAPREPVKGRALVLLERVRAGERVDALAEEAGVRLDTIIQHLHRAVASGEPLPESCAEGLLAASKLSGADQEQALAAFQECGAEFLRPVFEACGGQIPYEELHLLRLAYLARTPS